MKYNITLNQPLMIENKLNVSQWCILDIIAVAPTWCEPVVKENEVYYWIARQKIAEELKALDLKADTIYRYIKQLAELGFLEHIKDGKKDLIRLSSKGKNIFSTMSEKNPNYYVGKKSEQNSEKNPTYKYTRVNNNTKDNKEKEKKEKDFQKFWQAYPRKIAKAKAKTAFIRLYSKMPGIEELLSILERHKSSKQWKESDGKYIPHASTWLNQRRWEDEIEDEEIELDLTQFGFGTEDAKLLPNGTF